MHVCHIDFCVAILGLWWYVLLPMCSFFESSGGLPNLSVPFSALMRGGRALGVAVSPLEYQSLELAEMSAPGDGEKCALTSGTAFLMVCGVDNKLL